MKALLVIDWQKEYIDKQSDYYVDSDLKSETKNLNELIQKCRKNSFLIVFMRHNETVGKNFLQGSANANLIEELQINNSDYIVDKFHISSFYKTKLEKILIKNRVKELYVCGILTNLCVRSAVSDAYDREYNVKVIKDLCISFSTEMQEFTLKDLKYTRPEIEMVSLSEI
ncbi:cysteine hydrolase [Candidatus Dojkabacteria bacterium]|jgi:nicotinamidase-related amidase|nr:cysteine hydrolase [Candidatus Dojkabacteria bacterium]